MSKHYVFVANWKMQLSYAQTILYCRKNHQELKALAALPHIQQLIICPTMPAINAVKDLMQDTSVLLGAQDCSCFSAGPYTGEVSAKSLAEIGCAYCLVGHSERRIFFGETDARAAQKIDELLNEKIVPILCVGETYQEYCSGLTQTVLENHLRALTENIRAQNRIVNQLLCAYEPIWAVGTGIVAVPEVIEPVLRFMHAWFLRECPQIQKVTCLYGGSLDEKNIQKMISIKELDGFLVGGASLDFQKFKNMLSYGL